MEEFTDSVGLKIVFGIIALSIIGFLIVLITSVGLTTKPGLVIYFAVILIFPLLAIISKIIRKVIVSADSIISVRLFGRRELLTSNVKGFRIGDKIINIEPLSATDKKIVIRGFSDLGNHEDLTRWLRENFTDLDAKDLHEEQNKILHDSTLGITEKERKDKLSKARQIAVGYNITGAVLGVAGFFMVEKPVVLALLVIYPLLAIVVMKVSRGLIKFVSSKKKSVYPSVLIGFYLPALVLFITSIVKYDIFNYQAVWPIAIGVSVAVVILLGLTGINKSASSVNGQVVFMIVLSCLYGYGSTVGVNCSFDESKPQVYNATVIDHHLQKGKSTTYYLMLSPWGPRHEPAEVTVGRSLYQQVAVGQTVDVNYRKGFLNIPWYSVSAP